MMEARVWGIGLTRTGTTSLAGALGLLGYQARHWPRMTELLGHAPPAAATDETVALCFRYLDLRYPGSKFILTVRDEESWLRSAEHHHRDMYQRISQFMTELPTDPFAGLAGDPVGLLHALDQWLTRYRATADNMHGIIADIMFTQLQLYGIVGFDRDRFIEGRRRHHDAVRAHFRDRPGDLLTLDIVAGEGWEPLCRFLDKPIPSDVFPHEHHLP